MKYFVYAHEIGGYLGEIETTSGVPNWKIGDIVPGFAHGDDVTGFALGEEVTIASIEVIDAASCRVTVKPSIDQPD